MLLLYVALAWLLGILLANALLPPWQALLVLVLVVLLSIALARSWDDGRRGRYIRLTAWCALALLLGAGRLLLVVPHRDATTLATYNEAGWVTLEGVVVGEPDERDAYTNLSVEAEQLALADGEVLEVEGRCLVRVNRYPQRRYGDRIRAEGLLEAPPAYGPFSYREYLSRKGIHSVLRQAQVTPLAENEAGKLRYYLLSFKRHARSTIASILPEPQAALLTGILLGAEGGIPRRLMDDFAATGTTHIIAISGFNITLLSGLFTRLARRLFDRRRAFLFAVAGVAAYTALVGGSWAVVRAAMMGILCLWARDLGREAYPPVVLGVAAFLGTLIDPYALWDVGFELSFAATAGLLLYVEPLEQGLERVLTRAISTERAQRTVRLVSDSLVVTVAAQLATTPIIMTHFGQLSLVTLLSNFLILPVQPAVMIIGGISTLLGLVAQPLGRVAGWVAWVFLTYTIENYWTQMTTIPGRGHTLRRSPWCLPPSPA